MKRMVKFRGKRTDNGEWVYGYLLAYQYEKNGGDMPNDEYGYFIQSGKDPDYHFEVDPKTVGEFTGLFDCNGTEIYEDDHFGNKWFPVLYNKGAFRLGGMLLVGYLDGSCIEQVGEIKGNVHEEITI